MLFTHAATTSAARRTTALTLFLVLAGAGAAICSRGAEAQDV